MHGWPVLVHYCDSCSYNTAVSFSPTAWQDVHICTHCGQGSRGADTQGQSQGTMSSHQQDELAQMFRSMNVSQTAQAQPPMVVEEIIRSPEKEAEATLHFVSGHYTQTAHLRPDTTSEPSRSPPPPYQEAYAPTTTADILRQHSIDPAALLPAQIDLFENANYDQRLRLLELWRISPPKYPQNDHNAAWAPVTVEREAAEAKQRYEKTMGISVAVETAEPYITHGYQFPSPSVDPVYGAAPGLWQSPNYAQPTQQAMEDQYGLYDQIRNHADWERLNDQIARQKMMSMQEDEDMVM